MIKILLSFSIFISTTIYSYKIDSGTTGLEFNIGNVYLPRDSKIIEKGISEIKEIIDRDLSFWYIAHNYIKYDGLGHFYINSHLGINRNLILQNATDFSYKNIFAGITVGYKYKYLPRFGIIVPEVSVGGAFNIISDWITEGVPKHYLSFFTGIHLGAGFWLDISKDLGLIGFKADFDFGYANHINTKTERENIYIIMLYMSFDFYND